MSLKVGASFKNSEISKMPEKWQNLPPESSTVSGTGKCHNTSQSDMSKRAVQHKCWFIEQNPTIHTITPKYNTYNCTKILKGLLQFLQCNSKVPYLLSCLWGVSKNWMQVQRAFLFLKYVQQAFCFFIFLFSHDRSWISQEKTKKRLRQVFMLTKAFNSRLYCIEARPCIHLTHALIPVKSTALGFALVLTLHRPLFQLSPWPWVLFLLYVEYRWLLSSYTHISLWGG
jgi:hypothetical protein